MRMKTLNLPSLWDIAEATQKKHGKTLINKYLTPQLENLENEQQMNPRTSIRRT